MESIKLLQRRPKNEHVQGRPPLRRHGFIKSTPLEGRAAPTSCWCWLSCFCAFCAVSDSWLVSFSCTRRTYTLEVLQSEPPRLAPYPKAKTEQKKNTKSNKQSYDARKSHADWVLAGRLVNKIGHLQLNKKDSLVVVKFLCRGWTSRGNWSWKTSTQWRSALCD